MKNVMRLSRVALSLPFLITSLLISSKAQSGSTAINLEGTQWEGLIRDFNTLNGLGTQQLIYVFDKAGRVSLNVLTIQPPPPSFTYNVTSGKYEPTINVTPIASVTPLEVGSYQVKGKSIHIEFSDHSIDAFVDGNIMRGDIVYKRSKEKEGWIVKVSTKTNNSSPSSSVTSYPNVIRDIDGKFSPANGFRWVNPCGLDDFQVEPTTKQQIAGISAKATNEPPITKEEEERLRKAFNLYRAAHLTEESGNLTEAVKNYSAAIAVTSEDARLYFWRAGVLLTLQNYRGAISDYDKFIDIYLNFDCRARSQKNSTYAPFAVNEFSIENVYYNRAVAKERFGYGSFACIDFRKACSLGSSKACEKVRQVCN